MRKCPVCNCQVKNCKCHQFAQTCKTCRTRDTLDEEGNCTCCPLCGESKTKGRCSGDTTCQLSTETEMPGDSTTMSMPAIVQEPPDISVLKDRSRLEYYITALKDGPVSPKPQEHNPNFTQILSWIEHSELIQNYIWRCRTISVLH